MRITVMVRVMVRVRVSRVSFSVNVSAVLSKAPNNCNRPRKRSKLSRTCYCNAKQIEWIKKTSNGEIITFVYSE